MRRHALNRITHRPERPQRSRIDTERHRLAAAQPAADVCPVIDRARSQRLGTARGKGAPDCPLYRPAALGRRARPFAQIRVVCPFHWRCGDDFPGWRHHPLQRSERRILGRRLPRPGGDPLASRKSCLPRSTGCRHSCRPEEADRGGPVSGHRQDDLDGVNQNRLPDRQVGEVGARLVLLLLRLDTVSGALQKLEDVLQHVAAWRGRLGAATARQLPLHPGSKRQARPVRAGRNHRYQVGDGLRRGTRRPEHSIYLNWNILPIGQQLWEKTDGALTQIELWALFATGAVVFALVAANVWFRFIKYDDAPSVNPPHRAVARSQGWLRAARLSISPRAERNRLRRGQQRSDRMAVGGGAIRPRQAERAAIRTIHFARRRDIGAIRAIPKRDGAMDQRPAHAGAQRVFQHSQSFLAEQFPRRSLPITEGWSRAAHRIELDDPPARHNHCTGA